MYGYEIPEINANLETAKWTEESVAQAIADLQAMALRNLAHYAVLKAEAKNALELVAGIWGRKHRAYRELNLHRVPTPPGMQIAIRMVQAMWESEVKKRSLELEENNRREGEITKRRAERKKA